MEGTNLHAHVDVPQEVLAGIGLPLGGVGKKRGFGFPPQISPSLGQALRNVNRFQAGFPNCCLELKLGKCCVQSLKLLSLIRFLVGLGQQA